MMTNNKTKKVSVIIPAYNVGDYIGICLDSVVNQLYRNIEVIVVDDGSEDETGRIVDSFCEKYGNIFAVHTNNNGQQIARKKGIELASGEYLVFVDGDDYVKPGYVSDLIMHAEGVDIVTSGINKLDIDGNVVEKWTDNYAPGKYTDDNGLMGIFANLIIFHGENKKRFIGGVINSQCCKLFKSSIVKEIYKDVCDGGICSEEDWLFVLSYMLRCNSFYFSDVANYCYRYNPNSVVHSVHDDFLDGCASFYRIAKKHILESDYSELLRPQFEKRFMHMVISGFQTYMDIDSHNCLPVYTIDEIEAYYDKKVILYGAGNVGCSYYNQIIRHDQIEIVAWADKDYMKNNRCLPPIKIKDIEYDYVIIAVYYAKQAEIIKEELCDLGIAPERIIWKEPVCFLDDYFLS